MSILDITTFKVCLRLVFDIILFLTASIRMTFYARFSAQVEIVLLHWNFPMRISLRVVFNNINRLQVEFVHKN